jgi:hypothetical protein
MRQISHPNCEHYQKIGCCKLYAYCQILHGVECYSQKPLEKQHPKQELNHITKTNPEPFN